MRTDKQWLIAIISYFTPTESILTITVMILGNSNWNWIRYFWFYLFSPPLQKETFRILGVVVVFYTLERFLFQKCISYLCFPSSQLASICCRLGLANSSAVSRRLEKLAANKSRSPSCFPCLEWWTTLPLIYEMIWEVCVWERRIEEACMEEETCISVLHRLSISVCHDALVWV